jgi:hypothetical protein
VQSVGEGVANVGPGSTRIASNVWSLAEPLIIEQLWPDILILDHISGYLTNAQLFTLREHYIVCAARCTRL